MYEESRSAAQKIICKCGMIHVVRTTTFVESTEPVKFTKFRSPVRGKNKRHALRILHVVAKETGLDWVPLWQWRSATGLIRQRWNEAYKSLCQEGAVALSEDGKKARVHYEGLSDYYDLWRTQEQAIF